MDGHERDPDFLDRLRSGDAEAFRLLVRDTKDRIVRTCYRFLRNTEDAEETALDVFVEVHESLPDFRGDAELSTWIYRIAVTKSLDALRRRKRKKRSAAGSSAHREDVAVEVVPAPAETGPEQVLEIRERSRILQEAISALPENQRVAVILARFEGLDSKAVAAVLNTSVPAVDSLLYRAHGNLRKILTQYYGKSPTRRIGS